MRGEGQRQEYAKSGSSPVIRIRTSRTDHFSLASTLSFSAATVQNKVPRNKGKSKLCLHAKQSRNCHVCVPVYLLYIIKFLTWPGLGKDELERGVDY